MAGFSNITGDESILFADNASFDGTERGGKLTTNGQLWIGSTASPHVRKGALASTDGSLTITNGAGTIDLKVAGGTTTVQTLTPNSGAAVSPVAGNIDDKGIAFGSGSTFPLLTRNGGAGVFQIADQTYLSPYVVDYNSSSFGAAGTYSSIQAALNQMITDNTTKQTIYVRGGFALESVTFPDGCFVTIIGLQNQVSSVNTGPLSQGNWTIGDCFVQLQNISLTNGGGSTITQTAGTLIITDCNIAGAAANAYSASGGSMVAYRTSFGAMALSSNANVTLFDCNCGTPNVIVMSNSANLFAKDCQIFSMTLANSATFTILDSEFWQSGSITGSTSAECSLFGNTFQDSSGISATGTFNSAGNNSLDGDTIFTSASTVAPQVSEAGNLRGVTLPAGDYTVQVTDHFVGATTSAARAISLPATPFVREWHTIADITGNAAVNNITVSGNGNNILSSSSAATYVINANGGSADFIWTGSVWKVI